MFKRKVRLLFLDRGNACRSQIALGLAEQFGINCLQVKSAGIEAQPMNLDAIATMARIGIDISNQSSCLVNDELLNWSDTVITLCAHAQQNCPTLPAGTQHVHWPQPDLAKIHGSKKEIEKAFDESRDKIKSQIEGLIGGLKMLSRSSFE